MKIQIGDRTGSPPCLDTDGFGASRLKNETSQLNLQEQSEDDVGDGKVVGGAVVILKDKMTGSQ